MCVCGLSQATLIKRDSLGKFLLLSSFEFIVVAEHGKNNSRPMFSPV